MTTSHFGELLDLHGLGEDRKRNRSYTDKVSEQGRKAVGGGRGGKTIDQGELWADDRDPNTELGQRVERTAQGAGSSKEG
ncbi:MAG: hypothetical protein WAK20_12030 [Candidatus Acidiferrum sp.]